MKRYGGHAIFASICFLVSDITSVVALGLYQPLLKHADFITSANADEQRILLGAALELLLAISVAGTAISLYPVLRRSYHSLSLGYVIGRAAEATIIIIGVISLLAVLSLRHDFLTDKAHAVTYQTISQALVALHDWTFLIGPNIILAVNATILGFVLFRSRVVPRAIAILALVDGPLLFASGIAVMFGAYSQTSALAAIIALPMAIFEISLAVRLLVKGFDLPLAGDPASAATPPATD